MVMVKLRWGDWSNFVGQYGANAEIEMNNY